MRRYVTIAFAGVCIYLVYLFFFSNTSVIQRLAYQRTIDSLQTTLDQTTESVEYYRQLNHRLESDPQTIERVVREEHNMTAPGEEVFLAVPDSK